jgi:hypothetical protein
MLTLAESTKKWLSVMRLSDGSADASGVNFGNGSYDLEYFVFASDRMILERYGDRSGWNNFYIDGMVRSRWIDVR